MEKMGVNEAARANCIPTTALKGRKSSTVTHGNNLVPI